MNDILRGILEERAERERELHDTITRWSLLFGVIGDLPGVPERLERVAELGGDNAAFLLSQAEWARRAALHTG